MRKTMPDWLSKSEKTWRHLLLRWRTRYEWLHSSAAPGLLMKWRSWQKYTAVRGDSPVWKRHAPGRRIAPNLWIHIGYDVRINMLPRAVFRKWQDLRSPARWGKTVEDV